ncbi:MAG TPA: hypothetical protein VIZ43_20070 [Trebonia sp.]
MNAECPAGCCPHDGASLGGGCPRDIPDAPLRERVAHLRTCQLLTVARISVLTGIERQAIGRLLYEVVAEAGPGGAGRRTVRQATEDEWVRQVLADGPAQRRMARWPSSRGPSEIELLAALYADQQVRQVLDKHGIPVAAVAGPALGRFPAPKPLTADLVSDLYEGCGLSLHHIELLTGRPGAAAGAVLRAKGLRLRPTGARSPFTERLR